MRAFVRDANKAVDLGVRAQDCFVGDLKDPAQVADAMKDCENLIIAAGATPVMEMIDSGKPSFRFLEGQRPEDIDYKATLHQVEAAKAEGVKRVVLVSSAGVTDPDHRLNRLGDSQLLRWKLKAENALRQSGLSFVIIRPGQLLNDEPAGAQQLKVTAEDAEAGRVRRSDVAAVCVSAALDHSLPSLTFNLFAESGEASIGPRELLHSLAGAC